MSDNGERGFGFDFQIDPYRHGGMPAAVTSVPYPVEAEVEISSVVEGAFDTELIQLLEEFTSSSVALSGDMRDTLKRYYTDEEIDAVMAVALAGELDTVLKFFDAGIDEFQAVMPVALSGSLRRILIRITMPTDSFNGVTAVATGGTLQ